MHGCLPCGCAPHTAPAACPCTVGPAGGPGFEAARPTELSGWVKQAAAYFRIILLASSCASRSSRLLLLFIGSCSAWSVCASL